MNQKSHIYDISLPITPQLPTWPGDPRIELHRISKMAEGADANVTHISATVHIGTHVDAPCHFLGDEATGVESLDLSVLTGPARVVELHPAGDAISADDLHAADIPSGTTRLLLKTPNSALWARREAAFHEDFLALDADAAQWVVDQGIRLVGVDYLSVAPFRDPIPTHRILLQAGVIPLEGLNLAAVSPGEYLLYCLPLNIPGSDGAPARAILITPSEA